MSKKTFGMGLTLGALVGTAVAYLFAPKSGEEFQQDMKIKAHDAKNKAVVALDDALIETEIWLDKKLTESDIRNEPIRYERTPDNVAPAPEYAETPEYTESPDAFVEEE